MLIIFHFIKNLMNFIKIRKKLSLIKLISLDQKIIKYLVSELLLKQIHYLLIIILDNKKIKFITDGSKFKINKYTPKTRIKILKDEQLKKFDKIACIILAWNISNLLKIN